MIIEKIAIALLVLAAVPMLAYVIYVTLRQERERHEPWDSHGW